MKRKILALMCAASMVCSLAGCGGNNTDSKETTDSGSSVQADSSAYVSADTTATYISQTLVGKVISAENDTLTLLLGELTENETPPEMPQSGEISDGQGENSQTAPGNSNGGEQPPEKPSGENGTGEEPPEKPSGDGQNGEDTTGTTGDSQTPPELPEGDAGGAGMAGEFTAGDETVNFAVAEDVLSAVAELEADDIVRVETDENGIITSLEKVSMGSAPSGQAGGFGGSQEVTQGSSANTIDADGSYSGETYTSEGDDENALRVDAAEVTLDNITVNKASGATSNTENGDFYGMNAALLATNGATVTITDSEITSSAQNGNGVFSYGEGTTVNISDSVITTTADNSGGIQTTGGGTTNAENLTVETSGNSAAAIRSDRGGGTVNVDGGTYTSNGLNSPAVYSTADITVKNAELTANNSEALVIEGKNSITLEDCEVSGNMSDTEGTSSDENVHNVMIYQSMSGDADVGTSTFSMTGGTLTSNNGDMFYVTNTHCVLSLSGVNVVNMDSEGMFLRVVGNSASHGWGTAGENGAQVEFTAEDQTLEGDIVVDTVSTLNMTLSGKSTFTGTINIIENEQNGTPVSDNAVITIEEGSTWTLTGNCTITSLVNNGTINFNGYTITLADGTVLNG